MMWLRNKKPYKSTTIYNFISSLLTPEQQLLTPIEKLQIGKKYIFNFDYSFLFDNDNQFKDYIEMLFIEKYCTNYFAYETFEQWKIKLMYKWSSVIAGYSKVFENVLFNDDMLNVSKTESESQTNNNNNGSTTNNSKSMSLDFPQNLGYNIDIDMRNIKYGNNGNVSEDKSTNSNNTSSTNKSNTISYNGSSFQLSLEHSEKLAHIIDDFLNEFQELFYCIM